MPVFYRAGGGAGKGDCQEGVIHSLPIPAPFEMRRPSFVLSVIPANAGVS